MSYRRTSLKRESYYREERKYSENYPKKTYRKGKEKSFSRSLSRSRSRDKRRTKPLENSYSGEKNKLFDGKKTKGILDKRRKNSYSRRSSLSFGLYDGKSRKSSSSSFTPNPIANINRGKVCPFLLRVFYKENGFNSPKLFQDRTYPPELNIYTWKDADLEELTYLIHGALVNTSLKDYDLYKFSLVYYNIKGDLLRKEIGWVVVNNPKSKLNRHSNQTLRDLGFVIGDYIDLNITSINNK